MESIRTPAGTIRERIPEALLEERDELSTTVLVVAPGSLIQALTVLRDDCGFDMLVDVSAVDWLPRSPRFDVNYHLLSLSSAARVRVKVQLDGDAPAIPSCIAVWPTADWQEREIYDLMGITFAGHPNLRRILMPDEWIGHPLRKDYPVGGVPVEYKIEPAYLGVEKVSDRGRSSMGGIPPRLARDRGEPSAWTWTGPPAAGVRTEEPE